MAAHPADSQLYGSLFGDAEAAALFSDAAQIRAMLTVEGALARVQAALEVIPAEAGAGIEAATRAARLDPADLAAGTARDAVPVPALLAALRREAASPETLRWLHWGATSQDILDTAQALRLRAFLDLCAARLAGLIAPLGALAAAHAELPMAARTYGQVATPTSFGALAASWGRPLLHHRDALPALRPQVLRVSLSGAAGTLAAMGPRGPQVRAALAEALDLADPGASWHSERGGIAALGHWLAGLAASLGKLGEDLILLTQSGLAEVVLAGAGGSSTMPQKQNPVGPSVLVALARQIIGLAPVLTGAGLHRQMRDGAAWFTEWLVLPQMCIAVARALALAAETLAALRPDPAAMAQGMAAGAGTLHAEALTFALAARMPRDAAAAQVAALCAEALRSGTDLRDLAVARWPGLHLSLHLGEAPAEARAFARAAGRPA